MPARAATSPAPAQPPPVSPPAAVAKADPPRGAGPRLPVRGPRRAGSEGRAGAEAAEGAAREHLAAGRLDEALAAGEELGPDARARLEADVLRRADAVAALPRIQALIDLGRLPGLESEVSSLPDGPERERLRQDLELARKRPLPPAGGGKEGGFQLREFRPGWGPTKGLRLTLESALQASEAKALVEGLDGLLALAADLKGGDPLPGLRLVVLDAGAPPAGPGPATWRRAGEPPEALEARARWVLALTLADAWRLGAAPAWIAQGLPAALATAGATGGARPAQTAAGRALRRRMLARPPRGDGADLVALLAGQVDPVSAWGLATFAAAGDPAAAPARRLLERAVRGEPGAPPPLAPAEATRLETAWKAFLER